MSAFAFIFARGGSKGLPSKNVRMLNGKTLLQRSIDLAHQCEFIDEVYVSTDDEAIAAEAEKHGAQLIQRPPSLATDTASEWLAWQHAIEQIKAAFDVFVSLPTTAPLRIKKDVSDCVQLLESPGRPDIVLTMSPACRSPYFNMVKQTESGVELVCNNARFKRRQDAPHVYDLTTVAYATRPAYIRNSSNLFAGRVDAVIVPKERALDIDDAYDLEIAEFLIRKREAK